MIYWNDMRSQEPITEAAIPALLEALGAPWGPQVNLKLTTGKRTKGRPNADFRVRLRWVDQTYDFAAECKSRSTPKAIDEALLQVRRYSQAAGLPPMIIVPYLDERRLDRLADEGVSGIDLCGNGIAIVPGRLLLRRSGQPNKYPESQPSKYAYRAATSIVPRAFLTQPRFASVSEIQAAIAARGGAVAMSTVSKALARMAEDVLVERADARMTLVQPAALLDKLRENFRPPSVRASIRVKVNGPIAALFKQVNESSGAPRLVLTGTASQDHYAAGMRSDELTAYCGSLKEIRTRAGSLFQETERFADLTLIETSDRTPFFDARRNKAGVTYASPVQAYLELASGDKRDKEMANDIRTVILRETANAMS